MWQLSGSCSMQKAFTTLRAEECFKLLGYVHFTYTKPSVSHRECKNYEPHPSSSSSTQLQLIGSKFCSTCTCTCSLQVASSKLVLEILLIISTRPHSIKWAWKVGVVTQINVGVKLSPFKNFCWKHCLHVHVN